MPSNMSGHRRYGSYPFVTDNPFRLLCIPSSSPPRALRQKAMAAENAARVGLPAEVGLETVFGAEDLERCADLVRAMTAAPVTRCQYRQMWPYVLPVDAAQPGPSLAAMPAGAAALPAFHGHQWHFLSHWFGFLQSAAPNLMQTAIAVFVMLYENDEHEEYLGQLLREEGDLNSAGIVIDAQNALALSLTLEACQKALAQLEERRYGAFYDLMRVILAFDLRGDIVDRALADTFVAFGDRESARMDRERVLLENGLAKSGWTPSWTSYDPSDAVRLIELADTLSSRHPSAALWREAAAQRVDTLGAAMREYAVDVANNNHAYHEAHAILTKIRELPISAKLLRVVEDDTDDISQIQSGQNYTHQTRQTQTDPHRKRDNSKPSNPKPQTESGRDDLQPITNPPILYTFNGIGTRLYGSAPYPGNTSRRYSTLFFVVVFLPIFPIKRYIVSDAPTGGYYFHGSAPFTRGHKAYLGIGIAAALLMIVSVFQTSSSAGSDTTPTSISAGVASSSSINSSANTQEPLDAEHERLQNKITQQAIDLKQAKDAIDAERPKLEVHEAEITAEMAQIAQQRKTLDHSDNQAIDDFNRSLKTERVRVLKYKSELKTFNARVDRYNKTLTEANATHDKLQQIEAQTGD